MSHESWLFSVDDYNEDDSQHEEVENDDIYNTLFDKRAKPFQRRRTNAENATLLRNPVKLMQNMLDIASQEYKASIQLHQQSMRMESRMMEVATLKGFLSDDEHEHSTPAEEDDDEMLS
jgi:hypothetical protein